jgi:subtilase family serine protease
MKSIERETAKTKTHCRAGLERVSKGLALVLLASLMQVTMAADYPIPSNQTVSGVSSKTFVRAEDPSTSLEVSIWLNPRNKDQLDTLARELYDPASPNYRRWLKSEDIAARFAPSAAQVDSVKEFFEAQNLKVVKVGPNNFFVRARGTASDIERAFNVKLNYYKIGAQIVRTSDVKPTVVGPASEQVFSISGLSDLQFVHPYVSVAGAAPSVPTGGGGGIGASSFAVPASASADSTFFETDCFPGSKTESYTTLGGYPKATYRGNSYDSGLSGCGYSPANLYKAYGLDKLYAKGQNGAGQTIVILDSCGSPTIQQDANAFSERFGLPALTAANFQIIEPTGPSSCAGVTPEINLAVEWAHAIAPGAKIALVIAATGLTQDVDQAWFYAVNYGVGNVISGGFGISEAQYELFGQTSELSKESLIAELGAVQGIGSNFMSGDAGSNCFIFPGCGATFPASIPYVTAVGGVSLALNPDSTIAFQTGWSTSEFSLDIQGEIFDPSVPGIDGQPIGGYLFASGGGPSAYFAKPSFQKHLAGAFRQTPDISWLGDPFTGVPVLISQPGELPEQVWTAVGGTELATPMFSALWAIANQEAGTPLGQAAPYLYSMPARTINDIVPYTSPTSPTAEVSLSSTDVQKFNALQVTFGDFGSNESYFGPFYSAKWDYPLYSDTVIILTFGSDARLRTGPGWDDMTGLGTPNAMEFADYFAPVDRNRLEVRP